MERTSLSNIELYYTEEIDSKSDHLVIYGDEAKHLLKVMRHREGDTIYVTDGKGKLYQAKIINSKGNDVNARILDTETFVNKFNHITVCLPLLKSNERFEFALEKCTELGITNFLVFKAMRGIEKNIKTDRCNKILLSAMKQSLLTFKPYFEEVNSLNILKGREGIKFVFEQNAKQSFTEYLSLLDFKFFQNKLFLIFGPEGGLCEEELNLLDNEEMFYLTKSRLRTESAIVAGVSILLTKLESIKN